MDGNVATLFCMSTVSKRGSKMAARPSGQRVEQSHNIDKLVRVGQYELLKTIGKGNFAVVKLAVHMITKSQVTWNWTGIGNWRFSRPIMLFLLQCKVTNFT